MGRKALPEDQRRIVHGFSIAPATRERLELIAAKTGESNGAVIDRLVEAEWAKRNRKRA